MVKAVRTGESMRSVARRFNVTLPTIQRWVKRAKGLDLGGLDDPHYGSAQDDSHTGV